MLNEEKVLKLRAILLSYSFRVSAFEISSSVVPLPLLRDLSSTINAFADRFTRK